MASTICRQLFRTLSVLKFRVNSKVSNCRLHLNNVVTKVIPGKHVNYNKGWLIAAGFPITWSRVGLKTFAIGSGLSTVSFLSVAFCHDGSNDNNQRFFLAVKQGNIKEIEGLLKSGVDVNQKHELGWSALHIAAISGNLRAVQLLLKAGADPSSRDEYTNHIAIARERRFNAMHVLVIREQEFSDRLHQRAYFKDCTPLHYAVLIDDVDIVKELLQAGADPTLENANGHNPIEYAKSSVMKNVIQEATQKFKVIQEQKAAEERRQFPLEQRLKEQIIGQDGAINTVASAIRRKENGWYDEDHPLVFLFMGSSGIGKTELAKQCARYLHKDVKKGFIRIDMSEYQEKHEVAKFIGSPPGYVGHEEGGQLTKKLTECPTAVVLFDEVDKAHPDVLTIMLQLFDEGRLTDGKGKTIDCKDAIFIMTSNLASEEIANHALHLRQEVSELSKHKHVGKLEDLEATERITISRRFKDLVVRPILKRAFRRDEFLGRINEVVYFLPFSRSELSKLVNKELEFWSEQAMTKHNIKLIWDHSVVDVLAEGYDVHYGARSIKYEVERRVVSQLAMAHERQLIEKGCVIKISAFNAPDMTKSGVTVPFTDGGKEVATIKLQLLKKGRKNEYVDLNLQDSSNPFTTTFK